MKLNLATGIAWGIALVAAAWLLNGLIGSPSTDRGSEDAVSETSSQQARASTARPSAQAGPASLTEPAPLGLERKALGLKDVAPPTRGPEGAVIKVSVLNSRQEPVEGLAVALVASRRIGGDFQDVPMTAARVTSKEGMVEFPLDRLHPDLLHVPLWAEALGIFDPPIKVMVRDDRGEFLSHVKLEVPPTGRVDAILEPGPRYDSDRQPHEEITIWPSNSRDPGRRAYATSRRQRKILEDGACAFDHVQVGLSCRARFSHPSRQHDLIEFGGPDVEGAVLVLEIPRPKPEVSGRLVLPDGAALSVKSGGVFVSRYSWVETDALLEFHSDASGELIWDSHSRAFESLGFESLTFKATVGKEFYHSRPISYDPSVARPYPFGDIVMHKALLLAEGVVLDAATSTPITDVSVDLQGNAGGDSARWAQAFLGGSRARSLTGADGGFAIHAPNDPVEYRLRVSKPGYVAKIVALTPDSPAILDIRLEPACALTVVFEFGESTGSDALLPHPSTFNLRLHDDAGKELVFKNLSESGRVHVEGLAPGVVSPVLCMPNGQVGVVLEPVELVVGRDLDLGIIDVSDEFWAGVVHATTSDGGQVRSLSVVLRDTGQLVGASMGRGTALVITKVGPPSVIVKSPMYEPVELTLKSGVTRVELQGEELPERAPEDRPIDR